MKPGALVDLARAVVEDGDEQHDAHARVPLAGEPDAGVHEGGTQTLPGEVGAQPEAELDLGGDAGLSS